MHATQRTLSGLICSFAAAAVLLLAGLEADAQKKESGKVKKVEVGKNVWVELEGDKRRVLLNAYVCNRDAPLEHLLCRKATKEHEAILAANVDAAKIHVALLLAGAEPGSPVQYTPRFQPASGTVIKVYLQYREKGEAVTVRAQKWVRHIKTRTELRSDWVFAGSRLLRDPANPFGPAYYAANDGDVICVANFAASLLDVPIDSPSDSSRGDLLFEAFTERIPPLETPVLVILEPVLPPKEK
jgi:hypothetical protein